jgi:hypothetical protein
MRADNRRHAHLTDSIQKERNMKTRILIMLMQQAYDPIFAVKTERAKK